MSGRTGSIHDIPLDELPPGDFFCVFQPIVDAISG
jgi:hypothetical protein